MSVIFFYSHAFLISGKFYKSTLFILVSGNNAVTKCDNFFAFQRKFHPGFCRINLEIIHPLISRITVPFRIHRPIVTGNHLSQTSGFCFRFINSCNGFSVLIAHNYTYGLLSKISPQLHMVTIARCNLCLAPARLTGGTEGGRFCRSSCR